MKGILISAFACDPTQGSEPGNGWRWASGIAMRGYCVHLITTSRSRKAIDEFIINEGLIDKIKVHYVDHSFFFARAYFWNFVMMYISYWLWQKKIYRYINRNIDLNSIDLIHHVTWGSLKIGSQLYKLNIPMLFGPVGGGQLTPLNYQKYLGDDYYKEYFRNVFGKFIVKFNPFSTGVMKNAQILVTNKDTYDLVSSLSKNKPILIFDAAINIKMLEGLSLKHNNNSKVKFLWVGRIYGFKGLRLILDAMNLLGKEYFDKYELVIVGEGPDKGKIVDLVKKYRIEKQVHFTGMIPYSNVKSYYESSDVFIYTSLRDSFPGQILEAQIHGLPVITLDLHGQSLMVDEKIGYKCDVSTPKITVSQIKDAMIEMIDNPLKREQLGRLAHEHAKQQTWDKKIDKVVNDFYPRLN